MSPARRGHFSVFVKPMGKDSYYIDERGKRQSMDDGKIIELFWSRSQEALERTREKYGALCGSLAGRLLRSAEDVEECVNDAYMALWDAIPPARPDHLGAYLSRIVRNLAMTRLDYLTAEKRNREAEVSFEELSECVGGGTDPAELYQGKALGEAMAAFLRTRDPDSRRYFLRRYYFFDSVKEIARHFGVSESKVKLKLFRTRNALKEYLIKEGFLYER